MAYETQKTIGSWAASNFDLTIDHESRKLQEEISEFLGAINSRGLENIAEELADIVIVSFVIAYMLDFSLLKEINQKMAVNRNRRWTTVNGVGKHIS